jgi:adenosylmethionine-8-amino-7-oxononanoate aminotransferase
MSEVPAFLHAFARPAAGADTFVNMAAGEGAHVTDVNGKRYIDALASLWYCNVGHGRREIIDAVTTQMTKLAAFHTFDRFTNEPAEALTARLAALAPMPDARVFLTSGGSESVDTALKLARLAHNIAGAPERTVIVSRAPSYHGVSYGALAATGLPLNQQGFGPMLGDVVQVPHDDLAAIDAVLVEQGDHLAAIIAEPVVGAGGVLPPSPGYLAGLRERCDAYRGFLILDEVICGFGRLGAWWGAQHYDVVPDLVTFAKGVTSGYQPLGGVLVGRAVRERLEADPSLVLRHGHTYGGHPTACAAALANLDLIEAEGLVERATKVGHHLRQALESVVDGTRITGVRGDGAVWAAALGDGVDAIAVRDAMLELGVIPRPIGTSTLAFCPPLVIDDADIDRCAAALSEAAASV